MFKAAAFIFQKSTTTGTGPMVLTSVAGYPTIAAALPDNSADELFPYSIRGKVSGNVEEGLGYLNGGGQLVRERISYPESGEPVDWSSEAKEITVSISARDETFLLNRSAVQILTGTIGSPLTIGAELSGSKITNKNQSAKSFYIIEAAESEDHCLEFTFANMQALGLRITAPAGVSIRIADQISAAGGYIETTDLGATVTLFSLDENTYLVSSLTGPDWQIV